MRFRAKVGGGKTAQYGVGSLGAAPRESSEERTLFRAKNAKIAKKTFGILGVRDDWRVHLVGGSWPGSGGGVSGSPGSSGGRARGGTRKGSPLGRKRLGCPGMFPAGLGFGGFAGFAWPGGQVVWLASGWASKMGSFGNSRRRRLRRSNSSTARRYIRSVWA